MIRPNSFRAALLAIFLMAAAEGLAAQRLVAVGAKERRVQAGEKVALAVQVLDQKGKGSAGVPVAFALELAPLEAEETRISTAEASTDGRGVARVQLVTSSAGTYQVSASNRSLRGSPIVFTVLAEPAPGARTPPAVAIPPVPPPQIPLPPAPPAVPAAALPAEKPVVVEVVSPEAKTGEPKTLILVSKRRELKLGSKETSPVKIKAYGADGKPLPDGTELTLTAQNLTVKADDVNKEAPGLQLRLAGGMILLQIGAGPKPKEGVLTASIGELQGHLRLPVAGKLTPALIVEPAQIEATAGEPVTLRTFLRDSQGEQKVVQARYWIEPAAGSVGKDGQIFFRLAGETVVVVKYGSWQKKIAATIAPAAARKIEIFPLQEPKPQATITVAAKVSDAFGNLVLDEKLAFSVQGGGWQVETPLVSAGRDGKYYAKLKVGEEAVAELTARLGELKATRKLAIQPGKVARIVLPPSPLLMAAGEKAQLRLQGVDARGGVPEKGAFQAKARRGTVSPSKVILKGGEAVVGYLAPEVAGEDELIVQGEGLEGKLAVVVSPGPIAQMEVTVEGGQLLPSEMAKLKMRLLDRFGNETSAKKLRVGADKGSFAGESEIELAQVKGWVQLAYLPPAEPGPVRFFAEADGVRLQKTLAVSGGSPVSLTLEPAEAEMEVGETVTFRAVGKDATGAEMEVQGEWVAYALGRFEGEGVFRATQAGEGVVKVRVGEQTAQAKVVVRQITPHALKVDIPSSVAIGEKLQAGVTVTSSEGRPVPGVPVEIVLRSPSPMTAETAVTDAEGKANLSLTTPPKSGPARVELTAAHLARVVSIQILPGPPHVLLAAVSKNEFVAGSSRRETLRLKAFDAHGNLTGEGLMVTLEADGLKLFAQDEDPSAPGVQVGLKGGIRGVEVAAGERAGQAKITASLGPRQAMLTARVLPARPVTLSLEPAQASGRVGDMVFLQAFLVDRYGNRLPATARWQVPDGLQIAGDGHFLLTKPGRYQVQAKRGALTAAAGVLVQVGEPATIQLIPLSEGKVGGSMLVVAKVLDRFGNLVEGETVAFSLDQEGWEAVPRQVKAGRDGKYYVEIKVGKGPSASLQAKIGAVVAVARLDAVPGPAVAVRVVPENLTIAAGEETGLKMTAADRYGGVPEAVTFAARAARGRVPKSGRVVGGEAHLRYLAPPAAGEDKITIEIPAGKAEVAVRVKPGPAAQITIEAEKTVRAGEKAKLEILVFDAHGNPLDAGEALVLANRGTFLGENNQKLEFAGGRLALLYEAPTTLGDDVVRVKVGEAAAEIAIKVALAELVSFVVEPASVDIQAGGEAQFHARGKDLFGNEGAVPATWRSEGTGQIDRQRGLYRATRSSRGTVVAEYGGQSAQAEVVVRPGPPTDIKVEVLSDSARAGERARLRATVTDAYGNPVPGVQLFCHLKTGGVEKSVQEGMSDEAGRAEFDVPLPSRAGHVAIEITSPQVPKSK